MLDFLATVPAEIIDAVGVVGFCMYVTNYSLLTLHKVRSDQIRYFALNWCAASCVLIGLSNSFNLAAAMIQLFFLAISTVAIIIRIRCLIQRNNEAKHTLAQAH